MILLRLMSSGQLSLTLPSSLRGGIGFVEALDELPPNTGRVDGLASVDMLRLIVEEKARAAAAARLGLDPVTWTCRPGVALKSSSSARAT